MLQLSPHHRTNVNSLSHRADNGQLHSSQADFPSPIEKKMS